MSFDSAVMAMDDTLLQVFGVPAVYKTQAIEVAFQRKAAIVGEFGEVLDIRDVLHIAKDDAPGFAVGDVIDIDATIWTVDFIESDDGQMIKAWLV